MDGIRVMGKALVKHMVTPEWKEKQRKIQDDKITKLNYALDVFNLKMKSSLEKLEKKNYPAIDLVKKKLEKEKTKLEKEKEKVENNKKNLEALEINGLVNGELIDFPVEISLNDDFYSKVRKEIILKNGLVYKIL